MSVTVKDFAKTLKISDKVLLERMQLAGLSHKTADDEVTPADKQACLSAGVTSSSAVLCDKPANCILSSKTLSEIFRVFAKSFTVTDKIFPLII